MKFYWKCENTATHEMNKFINLPDYYNIAVFYYTSIKIQIWKV